MSVVGLFAGIGGFERAFEDEGFSASLLSEIDRAAQAVLRKQFPHSEVVGDVRKLKALPRHTEIVTAGFPCQNLSMAGNKAGIRGSKSGIVDQMFRLIKKSDVPTVVIENVYFMLHLDKGAAMHRLVTRFERLGYRWAYRLVDTNAFGIPQRRRRVYLVASKVIDPTTILFADNCAEPRPPKPTLTKPIGFYWTEGRSGFGLAVDGIPPLKGGSGLGIPSAPAVLFPDGQVLTPGVAACERLQGFPTGWTKEAADYARRPQGRLLGNAVSVPVAKWVAQRIRKPGKSCECPQSPLSDDAPWPNAAFNKGAGRFAVDISTWPKALVAPSISKFRNSSWVHLSERALAGFVRRAKEGNLRFPPGFIERLDRVLDDHPAKVAA